MTDFAGLLRALHAADVEFVLIGGVAATVHGSARLTRDVDVVYQRSAQNHERLVRALGPLSAYMRGTPPGLPFTWDVETIRRGLNFTSRRRSETSTSWERPPAEAHSSDSCRIRASWTSTS